MIYDRIALDIAFELLGFDADVLESYRYSDSSVIADREDYMTIFIEANKDMNNIINYIKISISGNYGSTVYEAHGYEHFPYSI